MTQMPIAECSQPNRPLRSPSRRALFALLLLGLVSAGCEKGGTGASSAEGNHPLVGSPAPDFDLEAQGGGERASLASASGKVVLVDFWATWCVPCRASFPKYQALAEKYEGKVVVYGISEDDEPDDIGGFVKETGVKFPVAWDSKKSVASGYKPETMPTLFIVDPNGLVRFVHTGFHDGDEADVEAKIKTLLR